METGGKGNKVDVNMFKKWEKDNIIGHITQDNQYLRAIFVVN